MKKRAKTLVGNVLENDWKSVGRADSLFGDLSEVMHSMRDSWHGKFVCVFEMPRKRPPQI